MNTIAAIVGKFGETEYYLAKMKIGELTSIVGFAEELPNWEEMSIDEKMQRELNYQRVITQMVPYIQEDKERFYGTIIVDIYKGWEEIEFEPLDKLTGSLPNAYKAMVQNLGFISLPENRILIALDGQHRLASLRVALKGKQAIPAGVQIKPAWEKYLVPHPELADDDVSVIFIKHESDSKIRNIFNKINKYAKQTSRSENIIISETDTYSLLTRKLISEEGPLKALVNDEEKIDVVNWKSNTLAARSAQLTTLSSIYTIAEILLKDQEINVNLIPDEHELNEYYLEVEAFWQAALSWINVYDEYMKFSLKENVAAKYRKDNLLFKPVTQMALGHVGYFARKHGITYQEVFSRINLIDWSMENPMWENILVINSAKKKVITGKEAIRNAGILISYLTMGDKMKNVEKNEVLQIIRNARNDETIELPPIVI